MNFLKDKTVIITGASNGIGAYLTKCFLEKEANVIACDIDTSHLIELYQNHSNCTIERLDVSKYEEWEKLFSTLTKLDYLLNVAGIIRPGYIGETEKNQIDSQLDINLKGSIYGSKLAADKMSKAGKGHIINFASMAGIAPIAGISIYTASKFGIRGFSLAIAQELKDKNVVVSVVCPDATDTHMLDDQMHSAAAALTFSGKKILTVEEVGDIVMKEVIQHKKTEVWIPFQRGIQAYLGATFPKLARWMTNILTKQGLKKQAEFRENRS